MTERTVIRGDTYVLRRQVFQVELVDDALAPFPLAGCTVRATFKEVKTDPNVDATDVDAALKADITFNGSGIVTSSNNFQLPDGGIADDGILQITADATATLALPLDTVLGSDVEVTDGNGEVMTIISTWTLKAIDGYTNRTT